MKQENEASSRCCLGFLTHKTAANTRKFGEKEHGGGGFRKSFVMSCGQVTPNPPHLLCPVNL